MAVLLSKTTGNLTASTSWGLVNSASYLNAESSVESLLTTLYSQARSSAFTPGAITVDGLAVKLCERIGTTGTISVSLRNATIGLDDFVAGTEVTINTADLPSCLEVDLNGGWIFFKFASPVTLLAATNYNIQAKTSSTAQVDLWCDGTVDNLSRCLVTTTEQAPVAGDDLIITKSWTAPGTGTDVVITMDSTTATDYGSNTTSLVTPAIAICQGGTLEYGTAAATNYILRISGHLITYSGGTFHQGTVGTPIPRDSTAVLEFDCALDGDFGGVTRNLGTDNAQGLSRTIGKNVIACKLNANEAVNSTSLDVNTDTGWLDNDVIAVASTTRTSTQTEVGALNGNAGASSLTVDGFAGVAGGLAFAHDGIAPVAAEVVLITRNVIRRSTLSTAMSFWNIRPTATTDWDWMEIRYFGHSVADKRCVEIETTTGNCNIQFCSIRDSEHWGFYLEGAALNNVTISNNVIYNFNTSATANVGAGLLIVAATTGSNLVFNGNYFLGGSLGSSGVAVRLFDVALTFTNNTVAGCSGTSSVGISYSDTIGAIPVNISGNVVHSMAGSGVTHSVINSELGSHTIWRCTTTAASIAAAGSIYNNFTVFGNTTAHVSASAGLSAVFNNWALNSDSAFATTNGINFTGTTPSILYLNSCNFSTVSGILIAHTTDISFTSGAEYLIYANNCDFGAATEFGNQTSIGRFSVISSQKHDQTTNNHFRQMRFGRASIDTVIFDVTPSMRMTPNTASAKFIIPIGKVNLNSGQIATPTIRVRESITGDGTDYNGSRIRLIVKRNDAMGILLDTVLATATIASEGAFQSISGSTLAVTDNGQLEFAVDCDGTTGWINLDSFTMVLA